MKKIIYNNGQEMIVRETTESFTKLIFSYFPDWPDWRERNRVDTILMLCFNTFELYKKRGYLDDRPVFIGAVKLSDDEATELRRRMNSVQSLDDFDEILKYFDELIKREEEKFEETLWKLRDRAFKFMNAREGTPDE